MTPDPPLPPQLPEPGPAWFCVRCRPKQEHLAAGYLRKRVGVEVFLPRLRFRRPTRRGPAWVTEALFPGYLFARFDWRLSFRAVHHTPSVSGLVHFGDSYPTVPDAAMHELRAAFGDDAIHEIATDMAPGDPVQLVGGPFGGLQAVVHQVMPSRQRVRVLLEFLGRQTVVEASLQGVFRKDEPRTTALGLRRHPSESPVSSTGQG